MKVTLGTITKHAPAEGWFVYNRIFLRGMKPGTVFGYVSEIGHRAFVRTNAPSEGPNTVMTTDGILCPIDNFSDELVIYPNATLTLEPKVG